MTDAAHHVVSSKTNRAATKKHRPPQIVGEQGMKIKLTSLEAGSGYIRHARTETLRAVNADVNSGLVEPVPCATYLLAYDREAKCEMILVRQTALARSHF